MVLKDANSPVSTSRDDASLGAQGVQSPVTNVQRTLVEQTLQRIYISAAFARAGRAKEFLHFVVHHALDKPGRGLSEKEIATDLLHCPEDWEPKADPSVRIAVGRLRTKLERYYELSGDSDPVRIQLPKGTYVPCFIFQDEAKQQNPHGVHAPQLLPQRQVSTARSPRALAYLAVGALLIFSLSLFFRSRRHTPSFEQRPYRVSTLTDAPGRGQVRQSRRMELISPLFGTLTVRTSISISSIRTVRD